MKKLKLAHPSNRMLILILTLIIALNVAVLWFYGARLNTLWEQNGNGSLYNRGGSNENAPISTDIKFYIQTAMKSLYNSQPATDALQQRLYLPEAKIYLPLSGYSRTLVYRYQPAADGIPETLTLTASANTNALPATFNDVPCVQRHATVLINSKDKSFADGDFVSDIKLADGRTLSLYEHDNPACGGAQWSQGAPDKVISLLKQAKSY